jgi:ATP-dependent Lhr-like helicase
VIHRIEEWFSDKGWTIFDFQRQTWDAYLRRESGLVHAPTGTGKTLAVGLGPVIEWMKDGGIETAPASAVPLQVLWITPLRALAGDTVASLRAPLQGLKLPWTVELRTGDTATTIRQRQRETPPSILVTTPENLSLMLSYAETRRNFRSLKCVIADEWHELIGTKRGVQAELGIARLKEWFPGLRVWGLSATLGNTEEAMRVLLGGAAAHGTMISGQLTKDIAIETVLPDDIHRFPWAGHGGLPLLPKVLTALESAKSTLLFTNTRSQAEMWYRAILNERPEWGEAVALHHGSLERHLRRNVELQLHAGEMRCVVCTSSLDLGVDFAPVDQVIQLGGPKGVARLLQRAGRSGHRPGVLSRILCVPTQAWELVEFAAVREAAGRKEIEARIPMRRALDVLTQHMVTVALGGGFEPDALFREVRSTYAFAELTDTEWGWCLDFVTRGGPALRAYPQYAKVVEREGLYRVVSPTIARFHRLSIGTITSDSMLKVQFMRGGSLGNIEESFISRLLPGEAFVFAGQVLQVVEIKDMTVFVKRASSVKGTIPRWYGGRLPLSSELSRAVRRKLLDAKEGRFEGPEMQKVRPVLAIQADQSTIPSPNELLIERCSSREGHHIYIFPFEGRLVHEGLAALLAYRLTQSKPQTIRIAQNDYGLEMVSMTPWELDADEWRELFTPEGLSDDLLACLNATEMARRRFRDIARVAGLIFQGYPGQAKTSRQLQASSGLFFDVFNRYDPQNLLLDQARREVLEAQLEFLRLKQALERISGMDVVLIDTPRISPLAFPIWSERMQSSQVSSERLSDRLQRMRLQREQVEEVERIAVEPSEPKPPKLRRPRRELAGTPPELGPFKEYFRQKGMRAL